MSAVASILTLRDSSESGYPLETILQATIDALSVPRFSITGSRGAPAVIEARFCFFWVARNYSLRSAAEIGRVAKRDHSTVFHGISRVEKNFDKYREKIGWILREVEAPARQAA